mgnify:CR=1 FL=1
MDDRVKILDILENLLIHINNYGMKHDPLEYNPKLNKGSKFGNLMATSNVKSS